MAAARVESAATETANVHGSGEPAGNERAAAQDCDQDGSIQKKILQRLSLLAEPCTSTSRFNYDWRVSEYLL